MKKKKFQKSIPKKILVVKRLREKWTKKKKKNQYKKTSKDPKD